jgi:stage V sporulation protein AC
MSRKTANINIAFTNNKTENQEKDGQKMSISNSDYSKMTDKASPNSPIIKNCIKAFVFGGGICVFAQLLNFLFERLGLNEDNIKLATPSSIIIITAILTGIGVYDKIARHAGAGTIVPITGFANAVVSPALEFKHEGFVLGTAAQMFSIAGPVIVYGISSSVVYGLIIYFLKIV